jgi:hypothetical protein
MSDKPEVEPVEENENEFAKSKLYDWTKRVIFIVVLVLLVVGVLGSMHWGGPFENFVMADFVSFMDSYKGIFIALISSIAGGGIAKNILKARNKKNDDGKNLATGGDI